MYNRTTPKARMDNAPREPSPAGALPCIEFDSAELLVRLDITIPGDARAISPLVDRVIDMVKSMECASGKEFEIETGLREALANAIRYGCRHDPARMVQCAVACDHDRGVLIVVRDPGPGFDPASIVSPLVGENVFSNHGRGIYLINQLMDEVTFARGGTEIRMRKR
jgi:anti-sigma regulatory factor (Ser/Thr protein kinase)